MSTTIDVDLRDAHPLGISPDAIAVGQTDQGRVVITMTPAAAEVLAQIVGRGALTHEQDAENEHQTWMHVMVDLITASTLAGIGPPARPAMVPVRRTFSDSAGQRPVTVDYVAEPSTLGAIR